MITGSSAWRRLTSCSNPSPSIPGMLMSDSTTISSGRTPSSSLPRASSAEPAKCITYWPSRTSRRKRWRNSSATSGSSSTTMMLTLISLPRSGRLPAARQAHGEFGEEPRLALDVDRTTMLLRDDMVTDRQAKPRAFAGRLGGEKRLEQLFPDFRRDPGAVVAHLDLDRLAEIARGDRERRLVAGLGAVSAALVGGIEAVAE